MKELTKIEKLETIESNGLKVERLNKTISKNDKIFIDDILNNYPMEYDRIEEIIKNEIEAKNDLDGAFTTLKGLTVLNDTYNSVIKNFGFVPEVDNKIELCNHLIKKVESIIDSMEDTFEPEELTEEEMLAMENE